LHQDSAELAESSSDAVEATAELGWEDFGWHLGDISILFSTMREDVLGCWIVAEVRRPF
jgi:hypothetical protein